MEFVVVRLNGILTKDGFIIPQEPVGLMDAETAARYIEGMDHSLGYDEDSSPD